MRINYSNIHYCVDRLYRFVFLFSVCNCKQKLLTLWTEDGAYIYELKSEDVECSWRNQSPALSVNRKKTDRHCWPTWHAASALATSIGNITECCERGMWRKATRCPKNVRRLCEVSTITLATGANFFMSTTVIEMSLLLQHMLFAV